MGTMNKRKVIKKAGNFRFVKICGQHTHYAIQYRYDHYEMDMFKVKTEIAEYLNVKHSSFGNWYEFYIQNKKECNRQFTYCVLRWT